MATILPERFSFFLVLVLVLRLNEIFLCIQNGDFWANVISRLSVADYTFQDISRDRVEKRSEETNAPESHENAEHRKQDKEYAIHYN
jgi:hypothetical protein